MTPMTMPIITPITNQVERLSFITDYTIARVLNVSTQISVNSIMVITTMDVQRTIVTILIIFLITDYSNNHQLFQTALAWSSKLDAQNG